VVAFPAPPDTEHGIELEEIPVAQTELEPPYRILIHNDDVTPFDFVISVLRSVFLLGARDAWVVTTRAHVTGVAYVMTLPFEEAKYRVGKAHSLARAGGYPLTFTIEPDA
jgi:ATP-dependent Clp protease adaptor protein ClpS